MPGIDFKKVRESIRIAEVLELAGFVGSSGSGDQRRGPCPVHRSSSASSTSFSVSLAKNTYQCFKCGAGGDQLDLWVAVTRTNIHQAALDLCNLLNRQVPWIQS